MDWNGLEWTGMDWNAKRLPEQYVVHSIDPKPLVLSLFEHIFGRCHDLVLSALMPGRWIERTGMGLAVMKFELDCTGLGWKWMRVRTIPPRRETKNKNYEKVRR